VASVVFVILSYHLPESLVSSGLVWSHWLAALFVVIVPVKGDI